MCIYFCINQFGREKLKTNEKKTLWAFYINTINYIDR